MRADLKKQGWFVAKFSNNFDLLLETMVPAKSNRFFMRQTGFPDFIVWDNQPFCRRVEGVEVKSNGYLDKGEKARVDFYLKNKIFDQVLVAKKGKRRGEIVYEPAKTA